MTVVFEAARRLPSTAMQEQAGKLSQVVAVFQLEGRRQAPLMQG